MISGVINKEEIMKLDEYEIDYVKYFIQVKGYHQYEVLGEIMDHFILLLEERKAQSPDNPFEDLVNEAYETVGKSMFKEINQSAKRKVIKKYNRLLLGHLFVFLHYKYITIMLLVGVLIYHMQSLIQNTGNFLVIQSITTFLVYLSVFRFSAVTDGNRKFMSTKITRKYGFYLVLATILIFGTLNRGILKPSVLGFSWYYLFTTITLLIFGIILYSLIRTARIIVQESDVMDEAYQSLK